MAATMTIGLRRTFVAALIVALTLAGLGRALATTAQLGDAHDVIPGVHVPICHSGEDGTPADPAQPAGHDCCDACALLAPALLPSAPVLAGPAPVAHYADHAHAVAWSPVLARPRSPRLSRGPPAA